MAKHGLSGRVQALEEKHDAAFQGGVFIVTEPGETNEQARARWEAVNGPLDGRMAITWIVTGVPRTEGLSCA